MARPRVNMGIVEMRVRRPRTMMFERAVRRAA
jgi:hypothetical protein